MIILFVGFALLASAIISNKIALGYLAPSLLVSIRMLCAGLILLTFTFLKKQQFSWRNIKKDFFTIAGISLFTTLLPSLLKAYALKHMFSSKAAFLGSLDPFVTALYAYLLWHEKLSFKKWLGISVGFIGTMMVLITTSPAEQHLVAWKIFSYPELAALGAMAIGRMGWIVMQKLFKKRDYSVPELNGITMLLSGIMSIAWSFYLQEVSLAPFFMQPAKVIPAVLWTVIIGNVFGYGLYAYSLKLYSSTLISLSGFSVPIFVYFFGWLILGEPLSWYFLVATGITFIGLLIFYQAEVRKL